MTVLRSQFRPCATVLFATLLLPSCEFSPRGPAAEHANDGRGKSPATSASAVDPYQAMALTAGQDLIGTRVSDLSFRTIDGRTIRLGDRRARRPVYLKFWATWCVTCRAQMEAFKANYVRYAKGMDVVAVDTGVNDDLATVREYLRTHPLPMSVAIDDGRLGEAFHLKVTPQHVVIGREGVVRYVGHLEDERLQRELRAAIDARSDDVRVGGSAPVAPPLWAARPNLDFTSVQGRRVRIGGPEVGPPRLLYFLSPWCETYLRDTRPAVAAKCRDTRKALTRAAARGVDVIGIASALSADADGARRYIGRTGFAPPIVLDEDGRLFRRFGVRSFPVVIRLDGSGRPSGRLSVAAIDALSSTFGAGGR